VDGALVGEWLGCIWLIECTCALKAPTGITTPNPPFFSPYTPASSPHKGMVISNNYDEASESIQIQIQIQIQVAHLLPDACALVVQPPFYRAADLGEVGLGPLTQGVDHRAKAVEDDGRLIGDLRMRVRVRVRMCAYICV
jgi:hypothetical protein